MSVNYPFYVSDSGSPKTGLTPTFSTLKRVSDGANVSQPAITELGGGWYTFVFNPQLAERYIGVVDAGAGVTAAAERYISVEFTNETHGKREFYIHATPVYNEDGDALTFAVFVLEDGIVKTTDISSITLNIYDELHALQFTLTTTILTNGVAILTENSPGLTAGESYYVKTDVVTSQGTISSMSMFNVYQ